TSVKDADLVAGNLELRLVARETAIPYETREQAENAAKSAKPGKTPYTAEWEVVAYREQTDSNAASINGWIVVSKEPIVTSQDKRNVSVKPSEYSSLVFAIGFSLTPEAALRLSEASSAHIGESLAIALNGEVRSAPIIHDRISDKVQISGNFSRESAEKL